MANNSIVSFVVQRLINIPARVREKKKKRRRRREGRSTEEGLLSPSFLLAFFPLPVSSNSFLRSSRGPDPRRFPVPRCYLAATDTRPLASEFRYVRVRLSSRLLVGTGVFGELLLEVVGGAWEVFRSSNRKRRTRVSTSTRIHSKTTPESFVVVVTNILVPGTPGGSIVPDVVSDSTTERHVPRRYAVLSSSSYRATRRATLAASNKRA
ncbi:uncharacterized protein LOC102679455 isoform X1 [Apis dorsata]|uniref:uncharacterized protein LOC102679455 isoform X1 n=1 Tax=Apis dorsata TaxID=7462 RepID=UPI0012930F18|nr:uncharacterized protein LOC102679455 isoform X1 [Apis dorsata]